MDVQIKVLALNDGERPNNETQHDDASLVSASMEEPTATSILSYHDNNEGEYVASLNRRSTTIEDGEPERSNVANDIRNDIRQQQISGSKGLSTANTERQWMRENNKNTATSAEASQSPATTSYKNQEMMGKRLIAPSVTVDEEEDDDKSRRQFENQSRTSTAKPLTHPAYSLDEHAPCTTPLIACVSLSSQSTTSSTGCYSSLGKGKVNHQERACDRDNEVSLDKSKSLENSPPVVENLATTGAPTRTDDCNITPTSTASQEKGDNAKPFVDALDDGNKPHHFSLVAWSDQSPPSKFMDSIIMDQSSMISPLSTLREKAMHVQMEESSAYANRIEELKQQLEKVQREKDKEMIWRIINAKMVEKLQQQLLTLQDDPPTLGNKDLTMPSSPTVKLEGKASDDRAKQGLNSNTQSHMTAVDKDESPNGNISHPGAQGRTEPRSDVGRPFHKELETRENDEDASIQERKTLQVALDLLKSKSSNALGESFETFSTSAAFSPGSSPFVFSSQDQSTLDFLVDAVHGSGTISDDATILRLQLAQAQQERDNLAEKNRALQEELQLVAAEREDLKDKLGKQLDSEIGSVDLIFSGEEDASWEADVAKSLDIDKSPYSASRSKPADSSSGHRVIHSHSGKIGKHYHSFDLNAMTLDQSELTNEVMADKLRTVVEAVHEHSSSIEAKVDASIGSFKVRLSQLTAAVTYLRASLDFGESSDEGTTEHSACSPSMDDLPMNATFSLGKKNLTSEFDQENELEQMEEARIRQEQEAQGHFIIDSNGGTIMSTEKLETANEQQDEFEAKVYLNDALTKAAEKIRGLTVQLGDAEQRCHESMEALAMTRLERDDCKSELANVIHRLQEVEDKSSGQLSTYQAALREAEQSCRLVNQRCEDLSGEKLVLQAEIDELRDALVQRENELSSLQRSYLECNERIAEISERQTSDGELVKTLRDARDSAEGSLAAVQSRLQDEHAKLERLMGERQQLSELLSSRTSELTEVQRRSSDLAASFAEIRHERDSLQDELCKVERRLEQSKVDFETTLSQNLAVLEEKDNHCQRLTRQCDEMSEAKHLDQRTIDKLQSELQQTEYEFNALKRSYVECNERLAEFAERNTENEAVLRKLGETRDDAERKTSQAEGLISELKSKLEMMRCERDILGDKVTALEAELSKINEELISSEREKALCQQEMERSREHLKEAESEFNALKISYLQCNNRLAEVSELNSCNEARLKEATMARDAADLKVLEAKAHVEEMEKRMETLHRERDGLEASLSKKDSEWTEAKAQCQAIKEAVSAKLNEKDSYIEELQANLNQVSSSVDRMTVQLVSELACLRQRLQQSLASPGQDWSSVACAEGPPSEDIHGELRRWKELVSVTCNALQCVAGRIDVARREIQRLGHELASVSRAEAGLHRELDEERQQSHRLLEKLSDFNERNGRLENELVASQKEFQKACAEVATAHGAMNRLEGEKAEMQDVYEKRIERVEDEKRELKGRLAHTNEFISNLKTKLDATSEELSVVREELVKTEELLNAKNQESHDLAARNELMNHKCARLREYIRQLTIRCEEWSDAYDKLIQRIKAREGSDSSPRGPHEMDQTADSSEMNKYNTTPWSQDRVHVQELQKKFEKITSKLVELNWD